MSDKSVSIASFTARCYAVARCLSVCLSVCMPICMSDTRRYCVEKAKDSLKLSSLPYSHTIQVSLHQTLWQYSDGDVWVWKNAIFLQMSCFISEIIQTRRRQLLRNANRKLYPSFRMVSFSIILSEPRYQSGDIIQRQITRKWYKLELGLLTMADQ